MHWQNNKYILNTGIASQSIYKGICYKNPITPSQFCSNFYPRNASSMGKSEHHCNMDQLRQLMIHTTRVGGR